MIALCVFCFFYLLQTLTKPGKALDTFCLSVYIISTPLFNARLAQMVRASR